MEMMLLWLFFITGIVLFIRSWIKHPSLEWLLCYLLTAHIALLLGQLAVNYQLLDYPVKLFPQFESSILYEYLLLPIMSTFYYYRTPIRSSIFRIAWTALLLSGALTVCEVILESNTDLVQYTHWHWYYSLISIFIFLVAIRFLTTQIAKLDNRTKDD